MVPHQLAAAVGEDRRLAGEARTVLLAAVGRESFHATLVWSHAGQDRSASIATGVGEPPNRSDFSDEARGEKEECCRHRSKERQLQGFALSGVAKLAPFVGAGGSEGTGHLP
jgi:hypothetical protein